MPKVHETATLHLTLRGVDLTNVSKGWFGGSSSPTFKISAFSLGTSELWQTVKTSARVDSELNPLWPAVEVSCKDLCGCDLDRPIQVAVFDQDKTGANVGSMGAFETTVSALLKKKIDDMNKVDVSKLYTLQEGGKQVGMIAVMDVRVQEPASASLQSAVEEVTVVQKFQNLAAEKAADVVKEVAAPVKAKEVPKPPSPSTTPEKVESKDKEKENDRDKGRDRDKDKSRERDKERERERERERNKQRDRSHRSRRSRHSDDDDDDDSQSDSVGEEASNKSKGGRSSSSSKPLNENSVLHLALEGVDMANVEGWFGCSDPFFQIDASMHGFDGTTLWQNIHRSEHIEDNLNPKWEPVKINLDLLCQLDLDKPIRISIYDWEESGKHNPMGHFETTVNDILQAKASKRGDKWDLSKAFTTVADGKDMGKIVVVDAYTDTPSRKSKVSAPTKVDENSILRLTLEGVDMANVEGWRGCSDPFFQVETPMKGSDGSIIWQGVHRSEHITNTLNPRWKPAEMSVDLLCQLDLDKPIRFSIFDWEESGKHNPMGHFETSVNRLLRSKAEKKGDNWELARAFITKADDGEEFGKIVVVDVSVESANSPGKHPKGKRSSKEIPTKVDKNGALVLTLEGVDMANVEGWFGCSDPFFSVETPVQDRDGTTSWNTLFRSEHKANNLNPRWEPAILALDLLCQCDLDKPIRISVQDWEESGKHNPMGYFETSANRLLRSKAERQGKTWDLTKAFITKSAEGKEFGKIVVVDVSIDPDGAKKAKVAAQQTPQKVEKLVVDSRPSQNQNDGDSRRSGTSRSIEADISLDSNHSNSYGSVISRDSRSLGSQSGSRYSDEGSYSRGSYDSRRSGSGRSLRSGDSFHSNGSGSSKHPDEYSKRSERTDFSGVDSEIAPESVKDSLSDAGSARSGSLPPSEGSLSEYGSDLSGQSQQPERSRTSQSSYSPSISQRSHSPVISQGSFSQRSRSQRSHSPGASQRSHSQISLSPGNSQRSHTQRSHSPGHSQGSLSFSQGSKSQRSLSPGHSQGSRSLSLDSKSQRSRSQGSRSYSAGNSLGSYSRHSGSISPGGSRQSFSQRSRSQGSRSYSAGNSLGSYSRRSGSLSPGGSRRSSFSQRSRSQRSRSYSPSGSHRSYSPHSNRSYDSRRSDRSGYSQSQRSDSRSRGSRSYDSRSLSRSRSRSGSRSYSSRGSSWSGSRSYSRRSYSSRSYSRRSYSSRSYSHRSYSSRSYSRSRSPRSDRSRSNGSYSRHSGGSNDKGALKSSAWEALQTQATAEEEEMADLKFYVTLRGLKLANVRGWLGGKTAPFYQLSAHSVGTSQMWQPVYTSEAIEGDLNPQWKPASMSLDLLCAGDLDKRILVSIFDQNEKHAPMGSFETTVNKLIAGKVGGFGSGDNFDEAKTIRLAEDGKEMGRIVILSAHADAPKPKPLVPIAPAPREVRESRKSDASYGSYDSRRSRSRSSRSRSSRRSRSTRGSRGSSWRSYGSQSNYSRSSRGSRYSQSDRSGAGSESSGGSEQSASEDSLSSQVDEDVVNGLSEDAALHLTLYGVDLANVEGFFGTSDPFIQVAAYMGVAGPQMWQNIFRSEHVEDTLNPRFNPMELNLDLLCKRDLDQPIQFSVFDWEETGKHQPMGSFETTVNGLLEAKVFVDEDDEEVDTSKAFTAMHNGEVYGSIVVAAVRVENPEPVMKLAIKASVSRDSASATSGKGKKKKKKQKKGRQKKKQHQVKFNTHGDELSVGTIESNADEQILAEPKNVFGDENEDDTKSRPWKEALPTNAGNGFDDEIGNMIMGEDSENDGDNKDGSITNIAEILARVEEANDSDSDASDSDDSEGSDEDKDGSEDGEDDDDKEDTERSKEDENEAMLEMMSSMAQSMSYLAAAPTDTPDIEVDLEKFDEMYDQVIVDSKVVAEFEKKLEERARRGKKNAGEENEDPDLLRDTPRLILFESEKESKKKRGRKKKKGGSKFSQEFIDAMRIVFGDSDEESEGEGGEEKKEDEADKRLSVSFVSKRGSESSLFVGDVMNESKEEKSDKAEDSMGEDDDEMGKSHKSISSNVSKSIHAAAKRKRAPRKRKAPKVDPAEIFAAERRRQEGMKILSTSGLKQEMADMKKGLTRKMMERELANLRKATSNKFSPFDKKPNNAQGLFDDYNSTAAKPYGAGTAAKQTKPKPSNAGLMDHLAKNDDLKDEGRMKFDDLATVAVGAGTSALPTLADIPSLNALPAGVQRGAGEVKKKAKDTLGAIGQTASALGAGAGEQIFFSTQNVGDDDESQANVGLTGNRPVDAGGKAGLAKGQSSRKFLTFKFGKKTGGGGVQLDDDDGAGGYLNSEY